MTTTSYRISDRLFLNNVEVPSNAKVALTEKNTNHIFCLDCSGSMTGELPKLREQLKNKLPKMLKEKDSLSIIWFSGRGQFGALLEAEPVATLTDLKAVNEAIDRWLRPVGMTGFKEPLLEVAALTKRIGTKYPDNAFSLLFVTDGCENSWSQEEVLKAVDVAAGGLSAAAFIEYGYYADRPLLTKMAERAGGSLVHSSDFTKYEAVLGDAVARKITGGKKVEVVLPNTDYIGGIAYALAGGDIYTYAIDGNKVQVQEGTPKVWFLSPSAVNPTPGFNQLEAITEAKWKLPTSQGEAWEAVAATYAAISLFATRMKPEIVKPLLKATGDVAFISQYANCFGKQAYSAFMEATRQAAFGTGRWTTGWDPNKMPADDAFTVLDMLTLLSSDEENKVLLNHEAFKYDRIGRSRVDANTVLTADEQAEIDGLTQKLSGLKDPKEAAKISARINEITNKPEALKFVETPNEEGYSISNLTYNEERPNVSILVKKEGTVDLAIRKDKPAKVPDQVNTFIYRNYAVIKDGLVNVGTLPTKLSAKTVEQLEQRVKEGKLSADVFTAKGAFTNGKFQPSEVIIHLEKLPVINTQMVKSVSAKDLFNAEWDLTKAKAAQKVYNSYLKEKKPEGKTSKGYVDLYGADGATWLKEQGLTDYSGFAPKAVQAEATDFYMSKEMAVSMKGFSSLPALKEVKEKMAKGKLTASAAVMAPFVTDVEKLISGKSDSHVIEALEKNAAEQKAKVREAILKKAQTLFCVIVGNAWFSEFSSLEENSMTLDFDNNTIDCKVEMKETKQTV